MVSMKIFNVHKNKQAGDIKPKEVKKSVRDERTFRVDKAARLYIVGTDR